MFHRPYMYRRYHRSHRRRSSHRSHRCRRPHRSHLSRRSHRSPRAIAIRVGEMAACSDWVAPGDGALSGEAREAPEARHHIRRPQHRPFTTVERKMFAPLRLELRIEWHCCSPAPPTLILRVVTSPRADRKKRYVPFQCARPLSILRSGVGGSHHQLSRRPGGANFFLSTV